MKKIDKKSAVLRGAMFESRYKNHKLAQAVKSKMAAINEKLKK